MDRFVSSIRKSIEDENWFSALFLALALPDICGALEKPPTGKRGEVGERYRNWFNKYLKVKYDPENLFELVMSRNPDAITRMDETGIESLKSMPANEGCSFTGSDCYKFRCKGLHQGLLEKEHKEAFIFITPPPNGNIIHGNSINGVYQLQIDVFCKDVCLAVEDWVADVKENLDVCDRIDELMNIHHYNNMG
ncbi:hypothetical protein [Pseudoalteromonas sp. Z9A5]|uniref:hypothetical protein n=1 Tax=Pseudoalteromonas sp. Z9A5 TaxID=2686355 RepID=UPI00140BDA6A|nr:hypothetical protein [Pseudoalteromonas sp. Z9A5]